MKTALRPNNMGEFASLEALKPIEKADTEPLDEETVALATMTHTRGWKLFEQRVDRAMQELDEVVKIQMAGGANFESIGQSTVVKEMAKDVIRQLTRFVNDARESVESRGTTAGGNEESGTAGL